MISQTGRLSVKKIMEGVRVETSDVKQVIENLPARVSVPRNMDPRVEDWITYGPALVLTLIARLEAQENRP